MKETVYRNFTIGSKMISGRSALSTLSFELLQHNAKRPLCLIPEAEAAAEKAIRNALKTTVTVIGAVVVCNGNEEALPQKIADAFTEFRCDSLVAVAEPSLMSAVKSARLKLATGKTAAETMEATDEKDLQRLPPQKRIPLFAVVVPTTKTTYFPNRLLLGNKRIQSPSLFADALFVDPKVTKKAAESDKWRKQAALALMSAVWVLSDTDSHPAARACALSAVEQFVEAVSLRSKAEKTRLICNAHLFSKTALVNARSIIEIELLPFMPLDDDKRLGCLKTVFVKSLPTISFAPADLIQAVLTLCANQPLESLSPETAKTFFDKAVTELLETLLPGNQIADSSIWQQTAEAVSQSYLYKTEEKEKYLQFLQSQIGDC